jgi:hypothetical protein
MALEAYIGELDDPDFDFYGGDYNGNMPHRISPVSGLPFCDYIGKEIWHRVKSEDKNARQLDWGSCGVIMTKKEIKQFICALRREHRKDLWGNEKERYEETRRFISTLEDGKQYVVVVYEWESGLD